MNRHGVTRRAFLRTAGLGLGVAGSLRAFAGEMQKQGKSCILLWMAGGPSQLILLT